MIKSPLSKYEVRNTWYDFDHTMVYCDTRTGFALVIAMETVELVIIIEGEPRNFVSLTQSVGLLICNILLSPCTLIPFFFWLLVSTSFTVNDFRLVSLIFSYQNSFSCCKTLELGVVFLKLCLMINW